MVYLIMNIPIFYINQSIGKTVLMVLKILLLQQVINCLAQQNINPGQRSRIKDAGAFMNAGVTSGGVGASL